MSVPLNPSTAVRRRCVRVVRPATAVACVVAAQLVWSALAFATTAPLFTPVAGSPFGGTGGGGKAAATFSPSGRLLATAAYPAGVDVFSVGASGALARVTGSPFADGGGTPHPVSLAFRPDGRLIATANRDAGSVSVFAVAPSGALTPVPGSPIAVGDQPGAVAFSPDGSLLAVASYGSGTVSMFSVSAAGALTAVPGSPFPVDTPAALAFSHSGLLAVANRGPGTISMFSVSAAGVLTAVPGSPFTPRAGPNGSPTQTSVHLEAIAFDATGARLALASDANLSAFSISQTGALSELQGSPYGFPAGFVALNAVAFGPDDLIATAIHSYNNPGAAPTPDCGTLGLFSITPSGDLQPVPGTQPSTCVLPLENGGRPDSVAFSPSGDLLATGSFVFATLPGAVRSQPPSITGTPARGARLTCSTGAWTNNPTAFSYQWSRNQTPIIGATGQTYDVRASDEGNVLTCTQAASNAVGHAVATSTGVTVAVERVAHCPRATGRASRSTLGPLRLGLTRRQARRTLRHSAIRATRQTDRFCLTPSGITAGYPSSKLLATLPASRRKALHGRVVWITTASAFYGLNGIRVGSTTAAAQAVVHPSSVFHRGPNDWYFASDGPATVILEARRGAIRTIGLASRALSRTRTAQRRLLREID